MDIKYIAPSKEQLLLEDFLSWCGKEHCGVVVDITPNVSKMSQYTFLSHPKLIKEYLESLSTLSEGYAYE